MIKYSLEFYKKSFAADSMKVAYLNAAKWFATNVLSKVEFVNVHAQYVKNDKGEFPTVTIHLFAVLDNEADIMNYHCECCREMHRHFFINEDTHCNRCSALAFQNRLSEKINIKKEYYKDMLRKRLEE